MAMVVVDSIAA